MKVFVSGLCLVVIALAGSFAHAQGEGDEVEPARRVSPRKDPRQAFRLGVCVGQELAAAGIDVAVLDPSSKSDELKASFKTAMTTCRTQLESASGTTSDAASAESLAN